jgi:hypothetical protein
MNNSKNTRENWEWDWNQFVNTVQHPLDSAQSVYRDIEDEAETLLDEAVEVVDPNGIIRKVGERVHNYVVSETGHLMNEVGEIWDSVEARQRKVSETISNELVDLGEGLTRVGDFIVDEAGNFKKWVGKEIDASSLYFANLVCDRAWGVADILMVMGDITGVASCHGMAIALDTAIIALNAGVNPFLDALGTAMAIVFDLLCAASVTTYGVYSMPESAGDLQAKTCSRMPASNYMRNSKLPAARIYANYDPVNTWVKDNLGDVLCNHAEGICDAAGFYSVVDGAAGCVEKGVAAAGVIGAIGGFNPLNDFAGITLGGVIGDTCIAGLAKTAVYGVPNCAGDLQVSYCQNDWVPEIGTTDFRSHSQYDITNMSPLEMQKQQQWRAEHPDLESARELAKSMVTQTIETVGAANTLRKSGGLGRNESERRAAASAADAEQEVGFSDQTRQQQAESLFSTGEVANDIRRSVTDSHPNYPSNFCGDGDWVTHLGAIAKQNINMLPNAAHSLGCQQTVNVQDARLKCSGTPGCKSFFRYNDSTPSAGRTCFKTQSKEYQPVNLVANFDTTTLGDSHVLDQRFGNECSIAESDECIGWANAGECKNNSEYMLKYCPQACGQCGECKDTNPNCDEWATQGECDNNHAYMLQNCQTACNYCPRGDTLQEQKCGATS